MTTSLICNARKPYEASTDTHPWRSRSQCSTQGKRTAPHRARRLPRPMTTSLICNARKPYEASTDTHPWRSRSQCSTAIRPECPSRSERIGSMNAISPRNGPCCFLARLPNYYSAQFFSRGRAHEGVLRREHCAPVPGFLAFRTDVGHGRVGLAAVHAVVSNVSHSSGDARACAATGGSGGRPRWLRILRIAPGSITHASSCILPPQLGQASRS